MTASEKLAYLKGLSEGMSLGFDTEDGKLLAAVIDVLDSLTADVEDLEANTADLAESIDDIGGDLAYLEDLCIGDGDDGEDDGEFSCSGSCAECGACGDEPEYEVTCPDCGEVITVYESDLEFGSIVCPVCETELEFEDDGDEE